jgi:hypothetical protein
MSADDSAVEISSSRVRASLGHHPRGVKSATLWARRVAPFELSRFPEVA